ncbi:MAG: hypothetical protein ICV63_12300 [Coleofasciculus sp. Co-bin14]|jgi:hypothetical protein|nr:hypothetical protein [Coleofasciculus sp. Co-bin14]
MRHRIITALGVLAAVTGLANSVHAQPTITSNQRTGNETLSGRSLVGVSNKTIQDDFNRFFLGNPSPPVIRPSSTTINSAGTDNNVNAQQTGILQVSDQVQVITNDSLSSPVTRRPGRQNQPFDNIERVQVQFGTD